MRTYLFALLLLLCLPLQWPGAFAAATATAVPCLLEHCQPQPLSLSLPGEPAASAAQHTDEIHAQHTHCVSCHSGALALLSTTYFCADTPSTSIQAALHAWVQALLVSRPERPQWSTLA